MTTRCGFAAIIGAPNAGKSTLVNALVGSKVAIVSPKVQTTLMAVRGLAIQPRDLDLHVDDAYLAGRLMADLLVEPVTRMRGWVADVGGRAYAGATIEWLAGAHQSGVSLPHEQDEDAGGHLELVSWKGREIPVPSLDLQLAVAERRGLDERVALIRKAHRR